MTKKQSAYNKNRSAKWANGTIHNSPNGPIRIVEFLGYAESRRRGFTNTRAIVEFVNTGYVTNCQVADIVSGKVKDRRVPSVYGVGYIDCDITIPTRESGSEIRRIYDLWANMLKRCYGKCKKSCYNDVTVDKRWHSFKNFLNSVPELPGYKLWLSDPSYCLDKDTRTPGARVYSKDTCQFVTRFENSKDSADRRWGNK